MAELSYISRSLIQALMDMELPVATVIPYLINQFLKLIIEIIYSKMNMPQGFLKLDKRIVPYN
jgi:hypothetical protein